jgi:hypothetical protein
LIIPFTRKDVQNQKGGGGEIRMNGRFMRLKKFLLPTIVFIVMTSQLAGCSVLGSGEISDTIDMSENIVLEVPEPSIKVEVLGVEAEFPKWKELSQLRDDIRFRSDFDDLLHINKIHYYEGYSKTGCMYVIEGNKHSGNTCLMDAFRNKVFVEKYWNNGEITSEIIKLASTVYEDCDKYYLSNLYAALNAYYNLLPDFSEPNSFNAGKSVSREEFLSMLFRSTSGVREIAKDQTYITALGGESKHSIYAQNVQQYGYLNTGNKGLNVETASKQITRVEAVYTVVNMLLKDYMDNMDLSKVKKIYTDCRNAGNLVEKVKYRVADGDKFEDLTNIEYRILAYMTKKPDKGLHEQLYKAMAVAYELELLGDVKESRWDEPISRSESIELVTNAFMALNKLNGYLTTEEYGEIDPEAVAATESINKEREEKLNPTPKPVEHRYITVSDNASQEEIVKAIQELYKEYVEIDGDLLQKFDEQYVKNLTELENKLTDEERTNLNRVVIDYVECLDEQISFNVRDCVEGVVIMTDGSVDRRKGDTYSNEEYEAYCFGITPKTYRECLQKIEEEEKRAVDLAEGNPVDYVSTPSTPSDSSDGEVVYYGERDIIYNPVEYNGKLYTSKNEVRKLRKYAIPEEQLPDWMRLPKGWVCLDVENRVFIDEYDFLMIDADKDFVDDESHTGLLYSETGTTSYDGPCPFEG